MSANRFLDNETLQQIETLYKTSFNNSENIIKETDENYETIKIFLSKNNNKKTGIVIKKNLSNDGIIVNLLQDDVEYTLTPELYFDTMEQAILADKPSNAKIYIKAT
jgi:hypothetical protein